ncbi:MAG: hypothetical protein ACM34K_06595 [Bacillota bacterium]
MNAILDIIGSTLIGGTILLLIIRLNTSISDSMTDKTLSYQSQSNLASIVRIMDKDFKKIGLGVSDSIKIRTADSSRITFLYDKGNNGTIDSMTYYLSPVSSAGGTSNPKDRLLYRTINNDPARTSSLGVTKFKILYFDASGKLTAYRSKISYFKVALNVESIYANNNSYGGAYWEKIYKPKNL